MLKLTEKKNCCGCGGCAQVCPKGCIKLSEDSEGFLYPVIAFENCVDCKLCEKICPVVNASVDEGEKAPSVFVCKNRNESIRMKSSSGGIFFAAAAAVIKNGGCVFGAGFDADMNVSMVKAEEIEDIPRLMGSKYVQSKAENTFAEAKNELKAGRMVLYSGTPCQIEGLKRFLGTDYDKLYTMDFICHGVPSPELWRKYVAYREEKAAAKTETVSFRSKDRGWKEYSMKFEFSDGKTYVKSHHKDKYMQMFLRDYSLRPSCYSCAFKKLNRVSDITMGDFWEAGHCCPEMDDDRGLSLVFIHSEKGRFLADMAAQDVQMYKIKTQDALYKNSAVKSSPEMPAKREAFFKLIDTAAIDEMEKLTRVSWLRKTVRTIKWRLRTK